MGVLKAAQVPRAKTLVLWGINILLREGSILAPEVIMVKQWPN